MRLTQQGFIALPAMAWAAIGVAVVIGGLGIALKVQTSRLEAVRAEYGQFKAEVKVLGEAAIRAAKAREADDKSRKEKVDAENATNVAKLATLTKRLRDERASRNYLPPTAPGAASADTITLKRPDTERAIQQLDGEIQSLITEGDSAIVDLNTAKDWAQKDLP